MTQQESKKSQESTFGFLDAETNVFYAFESEEQYCQFLAYLSGSGEKGQEEGLRKGLSDEEMEVESQKATIEIMKIFDDLMVQGGRTEAEPEMMEIDF